MTEQGKRRKDLAAERRFRDDGKRRQAEQTYIYQDAGLLERHGFVPRWLLVVAVLLVCWGIYYLLTYWQSPGSG